MMPRFLRQFGLRTLLLFCTLAAVCFGLWRWHMTWVDHQHELAQQIANKKGDVRWQTWGPTWIHDLFGSHYFSQIVAVDWNHKRITDNDMQLLREISTLEQLYVPGNRITNQGMEVLADLPRLRRLAVWRTRLTDKGLETIGKLRNLEALDVHATEVTEQGFRHLRGLPKLSLFRYGMELTNEGIDHLTTMPSLELETLMCRGLSEDNMRWVAKQPKLKMLKIMEPQGEKWADILVGHPALKTLDVGFAFMSDEQLKKLLLADTLTDLSMYHIPVGDQGLTLPSGGGKLRHLRLFHTKTTLGGFLKVFGAHAQNVDVEPSRVSLWDTNLGARYDWYERIPSDAWPHFAACAQATSFTLSVRLPDDIDPSFLNSMQQLSYVSMGSPIDDRVMQAISGLPQLQTLLLAGKQKVSPAGYGFLKDTKRLKSLLLFNAQIVDEHLEGVGKIQSLEHFGLTRCSITDDGLRHITSLQNLEGLRFSACEKLTDEALRYVAQLPKLQMLHCERMRIGDAGLHYLLDMPSLQSVKTLTGMYDRARLDALKKSLPTQAGSPQVRPPNET